MSAEALLRASILGYGPLADLVDDGAGEFRFEEMPLDSEIEYPAIAFQRIGTKPDYTHSGKTDIEVVRMQYDCWDRTPEGARALADALVASFATFNLSAVPQSPPVLSGKPNFLDARFSRPETEAEPPIFRVVVDARHYVRE